MSLMSFLKEFVGYNKLQAQLDSTIKNAKASEKILVEQIAIMAEEIEELRDQIELQEEIVKGFDVRDLQEWYESRRRQDPWTYDGARLGDIDVKYYLRTPDTETIKEALTVIFDKYPLKEVTSTAIVETLLKYFKLKRSWTYTLDKSQYGKVEYWQDAAESWKRKKGDCDDLAILMNVLYRQACIDNGLEDEVWRLTFTAGLLLGEGGHAFNTFLADDGEYYAVESTFDIKGSYYKTWLITPIKNNNLYVKFYGFATSVKSWNNKDGALEPYKIV